TELKAVIFDYGRVLTLDQAPEDMQSMKRLSGIDGDAFNALYWKYRNPYDAGEATAAEYWGSIGAEAGKTYSPAEIDELVKADNLSWSRMNERVLQWALALPDAGIKTAILSNMHPDLRHYIAKHNHWLTNFTHTVFSCDVGMVKPDPAIYHCVLSGLGVRPEEALFLDDRLPNVEAAKKVGIHAIVFRSTDQVAEEVALRFSLPKL
ncbi:MAG: HAD family phosphatase, partial [Bryobacteraceae bacterium]|nr:HAD family phosphatase [Bryobacteraceae bacterium]